MSVFMIDVSTNNGIINWNKVRNAGVGGAMIKATQGHAHTFKGYLFTDSKFSRNLTEARAAGIDCGVYHWLTARTEAESVKEANYFLSAIKTYKSKINLYAAVDVEDDKYLSGLNKNQLTAIVHRFCETIQANGFIPIIYTNRNYLNNKLNKSEIVNRWKIWQAHWSTSKPYDAGDQLMIWQNEVRGSVADVRGGRATVVGSVNGIVGAIDCNIGYYDKSNLDGKIENPTPINTTPVETTGGGENVGTKNKTFKRGDKVKVSNNTVYGTKNKFRTYFPWYEVLSDPKKDRVVIGRNGVVTAAIAAENLEHI